MIESITTSDENLNPPDYGIVVMLDALGVSNYRIDETISFIQKRNELIQWLESFENLQVSKVPDLPRVKIATFGDTIIFTWATGKNNVTKMLPNIGEWVRTTIRWGVANEILLRGSISIGEYIADGTTVLGPAIADAAAWYEAAEWFGVILTPKSQLYCISLIERSRNNENPNNVSFEDYFVNYPVPLKTGPKNLWAISWPYDFFNLQDDKMSALEVLSTALWYFPMPKGTESKYENSIAFFNWYGTDIYPKLKQKK
jgi:hypothetical protein